MDDKIYFTIPGFLNKFKLNTTLITLMESMPEKFYNNIIIDSIFDSFPCIWNGGRYVNQKLIYQDEMIKIIHFFNNRHIKIYNTFTNMFLQESDFFDHVGNLILELEDEIGKKYNIKNGCIIYLDSFKQYINKNYKNFNIIWSTTKDFSSIDKINTFSKDNIVVPSYNINNDFSILKQLKYPQNIEILAIEDGCVPNCNNRISDYKRLSSYNLNLLNEDNNTFFCQKANPLFYYDYNIYPYMIDDINIIKNNYLPIGINKFKISGRANGISSNINLIEAYVNLFVKKEYKDEIRNKLLIGGIEYGR